MVRSELKRDRFRRLATRRTNEILHRLQILENCANVKLYEYDSTEVRKIFRAIETEIKRVKSKFQITNGSNGAPFSL